MAIIDLTGQRFNRLLVLGFSHKTSSRNSVWRCVCECGRETLRTDAALKKRGTHKSCGCYNRARLRTHGHSTRQGTHPLYTAWRHMLARCSNPKCKGYQDYGGRGITVCERWRYSLDDFAADVGPRPSPLHSIERDNNDGHYEPGNVRWATRKEQQRNRRVNVRITYQGVTLCQKDWAEKLSVDEGAIRRRRLQYSETETILFGAGGDPGRAS